MSVVAGPGAIYECDALAQEGYCDREGNVLDVVSVRRTCEYDLMAMGFRHREALVVKIHWQYDENATQLDGSCGTRGTL